MNLIFKSFIFINGIYDLLCAVSILFFPNTIIGNIHPSIFNKEIKCHHHNNHNNHNHNHNHNHNNHNNHKYNHTTHIIQSLAETSLQFSCQKQLNNRLLAYWLITYGSIRCFILYENINLLIALSYFIEAYAYGYEYIYYKTTIKYKVIFISLSSIIIGIVCLF
jgi:hypothetical protein